MALVTSANPIAVGLGSGLERAWLAPEQPYRPSEKFSPHILAFDVAARFCDGVRPSCTRCQALNTTCQYQVEAGESRWSALRRKNHDLERERDNYRTLLSLIQSRPEAEAQEIYRHIRSNHHGGDIGALIQAVREASISKEPSPLTRMESAPHPATTRGDIAMVNLPPLRSVVDIPPTGTVHVGDFLTLQQRKGSIMSAGSGPYSSPGTSDSRSSVSPQDIHREWV
ncbi:hypothetical protein B0A48_17218 [Cryoendolithus antarcticus]|uniref:Zn(2)-C6 fungal-type domain-containing protein n=1 Tax=Cryoendolithus antarcticus TaxID=1507870 RepID=A0A1V8SD87_9PEZI|nr:hypothetical protein B0A48_17218 [Cryoendolithus antarcticus]